MAHFNDVKMFDGKALMDALHLRNNNPTLQNKMLVARQLINFKDSVKPNESQDSMKTRFRDILTSIDNLEVTISDIKTLIFFKCPARAVCFNSAKTTSDSRCDT